MVAYPVWGSQDETYLRSLEYERRELVGVVGNYYQLIRGANVDPLYAEPTNDPLYSATPLVDPDKRWVYQDPVDLTCTVEYVDSENRNPFMRDDGFTIEWTATMFVARNEWEAKVSSAIEPKEGDVVYVFDHWFDVVNVGKNGPILDSNHYVGWKMLLREKLPFTPERKEP